MSSEKEIVFTGDIAKSVANELGVSEDMVLHHIDFLSHWVKTLTKDPSVLTIQMPHIGRMYVNISKVEATFKAFDAMDKTGMKTSWLNQLERHRLRIEEFNRQFEDRGGGYNRHKKRSKFFNNWFNKGMSVEELENWQNK